MTTWVKIHVVVKDRALVSTRFLVDLIQSSRLMFRCRRCDIFFFFDIQSKLNVLFLFQYIVFAKRCTYVSGFSVANDEILAMVISIFPLLLYQLDMNIMNLVTAPFCHFHFSHPGFFALFSNSEF